MLKRLFACLILLIFFNSSYAAKNNSNNPSFTFLPNIISDQLTVTHPDILEVFTHQAIELVKTALNVSPTSTYQDVRIQFIYDEAMTPKALVVFLLSSQDKSIRTVKMNLTPDFKLASMQGDYHVTRADLAQSPNYAYPYEPKCPDYNKQFVIGNAFTEHPELNEVVMKVYEMVKQKGYDPMLMNVYKPFQPQPTVRNYLNWMSCPNVKGFYNESHGNPEGIVLKDDFFLYDLVDEYLPNKLKNSVVLFDSCSTFHDPLLSSMTNINKGNAQQYMAGFINLPFGSSEKTAACFWDLVINHHAKLTQYAIAICASQYSLRLNAFQIKGNGDQYIRPPVGR